MKNNKRPGISIAMLIILFLLQRAISVGSKSRERNDGRK
jgi:hypothetical protein